MESRGDPCVDELLPLLEHKPLKVKEVNTEDIWDNPVEVETTLEEIIDDKRYRTQNSPERPVNKSITNVSNFWVNHLQYCDVQIVNMY